MSQYDVDDVMDDFFASDEAHVADDDVDMTGGDDIDTMVNTLAQLSSTAPTDNEASAAEASQQPRADESAATAAYQEYFPHGRNACVDPQPLDVAQVLRQSEIDAGMLVIECYTHLVSKPPSLSATRNDLDARVAEFLSRLSERNVSVTRVLMPAADPRLNYLRLTKTLKVHGSMPTASPVVRYLLVVTVNPDEATKFDAHVERFVNIELATSAHLDDATWLSQLPLGAVLRGPTFAKLRANDFNFRAFCLALDRHSIAPQQFLHNLHQSSDWFNAFIISAREQQTRFIDMSNNNSNVNLQWLQAANAADPVDAYLDPDAIEAMAQSELEQRIIEHADYRDGMPLCINMAHHIMRRLIDEPLLSGCVAVSLDTLKWYAKANFTDEQIEECLSDAIDELTGERDVLRAIDSSTPWTGNGASTKVYVMSKIVDDYARPIEAMLHRIHTRAKLMFYEYPTRHSSAVDSLVHRICNQYASKVEMYNVERRRRKQRLMRIPDCVAAVLVPLAIDEREFGLISSAFFDTSCGVRVMRTANLGSDLACATVVIYESHMLSFHEAKCLDAAIPSCAKLVLFCGDPHAAVSPLTVTDMCMRSEKVARTAPAHIMQTLVAIQHHRPECGLRMPISPNDSEAQSNTMDFDRGRGSRVVSLLSSINESIDLARVSVDALKKKFAARDFPRQPLSKSLAEPAIYIVPFTQQTIGKVYGVLRNEAVLFHTAKDVEGLRKMLVAPHAGLDMRKDDLVTARVRVGSGPSAQYKTLCMRVSAVLRNNTVIKHTPLSQHEPGVMVRMQSTSVPVARACVQPLIARTFSDAGTRSGCDRVFAVLSGKTSANAAFLRSLVRQTMHTLVLFVADDEQCSSLPKFVASAIDMDISCGRGWSILKPDLRAYGGITPLSQPR